MLRDERVLCHRFVVGELACGRLTGRRQVLALLRALPQAAAIAHDEALEFVEQRGLAGVGIGWIDVHLLASAILANASLWTLDGRLLRVARQLHVAET